MRTTYGRIGAVLAVSGVLALAVGHDGNSASTAVHHWTNSLAPQVTKVEQGHWKVSQFDPPSPPKKSTLRDASSEGYKLGVAINQLVTGLSHDYAETSASDLDEALAAAHEAFCFAFSWFIENRATPQNPLEMARAVNEFLAAQNRPQLDLQKVTEDKLEKLYLLTRQAGSTDELAAEVAEAVLC
jgi:hypothetical protein